MSTRLAASDSARAAAAKTGFEPETGSPSIPVLPETAPDRYLELLTLLRSLSPVFRSPLVPLAIGIHSAIIDLTRGDFTTRDVARALRLWCGQRAYRAALIAGAPRHDLTGTVVGEVTERHVPPPRIFWTRPKAPS
jgi:hypothetical protein